MLEVIKHISLVPSDFDMGGDIWLALQELSQQLDVNLEERLESIAESQLAEVLGNTNSKIQEAEEIQKLLERKENELVHCKNEKLKLEKQVADLRTEIAKAEQVDKTDFPTLPRLLSKVGEVKNAETPPAILSNLDPVKDSQASFKDIHPAVPVASSTPALPIVPSTSSASPPLPGT